VVEPLFFATLDSDLTAGSLIRLEGDEAKHAIAVRRMTTGEAIALGNGAGLRVSGRIEEVAKSFLSVRVETVEKISPAALQITLVQALAKGDRDELAIQAATELGIAAVIPWQADRSISIWKDEKVRKGTARWQSIVAEATKQSLRNFVPIVHEPIMSVDLVARLADFDLVLVLEPTAASSITGIVSKIPKTGSIAVVVGPEGGISEKELASFEAGSFEVVRLGSGILRTSTAGMAALAFLHGSLGDWD
jgi:16S rRNA (uracil1498-N3)-methyltransferase